MAKNRTNIKTPSSGSLVRLPEETLAEVVRKAPSWWRDFCIPPLITNPNQHIMINTILKTVGVFVGLLVLGLLVSPFLPEDISTPTIVNTDDSSLSSGQIISYEIISEEETSYSGCIRKNYKISVKDDATQNEIRDVLLDVYNKKKSLSDKTTIFVYKDSQKAQLEKEAVLYRGRLFMNPSCDESDEYQIDFDYWNIGEYTE